MAKSSSTRKKSGSKPKSESKGKSKKKSGGRASGKSSSHPGKQAGNKAGNKDGKLLLLLKSSILGDGGIDDIVEGIKKDHDDLRKFITVLKDEEASLPEKREAFDSFAALLDSHSRSEEAALYRRCLREGELRSEAHEGFVEHEVATVLARSILKTAEKDLWRAQAKVLAELVEHHIEEEERELLPKVSRTYSKDQKSSMEREFIGLRRDTQDAVDETNAGVLNEA